MLTKEINSHPANNLSERERVFKCVFLLESRLREQLSFWNLVLEANSWEVRSVFVSSAVNRMLGNFQWFGFLNVWSFKLQLVHFRSDKHHTSIPWFSTVCFFLSCKCWLWCAAVGIAEKKLQLDYIALFWASGLVLRAWATLTFLLQNQSVALSEGGWCSR